MEPHVAFCKNSRSAFLCIEAVIDRMPSVAEEATFTKVIHFPYKKLFSPRSTQ